VPAPIHPSTEELPKTTVGRFAIIILVCVAALSGAVPGVWGEAPANASGPPRAAARPIVTHQCDAVNPLPRPCDDAVEVTTWTSVYFEVTVPVGDPGGPVDPDSVRAGLWGPDGFELMIGVGQSWQPGYGGSSMAFTDTGRTGYGLFTRRRKPLLPATTYTVGVFARSTGGSTVDPTSARWSFTTRPSLDGESVGWALDLGAPTVQWRERWFAGEVKPSFDSSRMFDQEPVYRMVDAARADAPEFFVQQRDFPYLGDYWQGGGFFDGNPNVVRERETRRITEVADAGSVSILSVTDLAEGPLFGIRPGRPLWDDYHPGDQVLVADRFHSEVAAVLSVDDARGLIAVRRLKTPAADWVLDYPGSMPMDNPATPDNFSYPLGALRKYRPSGTPVYYWARVDDELDQHVAHGRDSVITFHGTPFDLCRRAVGEDEFGGACPDRPKDYREWDAFVRAYVGHLIDRHGPKVATWTFSVGNEPDLSQFWVGTDNEFLEYYDYTVNAVLRAFEEQGLDASQVSVGGVEATGLFPGYEGQILYHASPTADNPFPGLEEKNFVCANPAFDGMRAARVDEICAAYGDKGTPLDFLSVHSYASAAAAAGIVEGVRDSSLSIDPSWFARLRVDSNETSPDWVPRRDPASQEMYRWGGFFSTWGADVFRRLLTGAVRDPRRAGGRSLVTVWPYNYNFQGTASVVGQFRIDDDANGLLDRVVPVATPFFHLDHLASTMSHDLRPIRANRNAGVVLSGWRSVEPNADKLMLYAHDPQDTGSEERGRWRVDLRLRNVRFPVAKVTEYRIDRTHGATRALAALPRRDPNVGLYRPDEVAPVIAASALHPWRTTWYKVVGGRLDLQTRLLAGGLVFLDIRASQTPGRRRQEPSSSPSTRTTHTSRRSTRTPRWLPGPVPPACPSRT
jgi:glycosyl hydrolase family 39 (putative alpha-L-iduronidase)